MHILLWNYCKFHILPRILSVNVSLGYVHTAYPWRVLEADMRRLHVYLELHMESASNTRQK